MERTVQSVDGTGEVPLAYLEPLKANAAQGKCPAAKSSEPGSFGTTAIPSIHWHRRRSWSVIAKVGRLASRGPPRIAASPGVPAAAPSAGHVIGMPRRIGRVDPGRSAERPLPRREGRGAGGDEVIARIRSAADPLQSLPLGEKGASDAKTGPPTKCRPTRR